MLAASDEEEKETCMQANREKKREAKRCIYQSREKVIEQFGRKMNEVVNGNRKLLWKEVSNAKRGKVESSSRKKDGNGSLARGEDKVQKIWKGYFENLYNLGTQEQVVVHMCGFD